VRRELHDVDAIGSGPGTTVRREPPPPVNRRLGQLLVAEGVIGEQQLTEALAELKSGERLGALLVRLGLVTDGRLAQFLGRVYRLPVVAIDGPIADEIVAMVPEAIARKHDVIPIDRAHDAITLAMADPTNLPALDDITFLTGLRVMPAVAPLSAIRRALDTAYEARPHTFLAGAEAEAVELEILDSNREAKTQVDQMELSGSAQQAPVVRLANMILEDAMQRGASDIHLEPSETAMRIRFRVDGVLHEVRSLPRAIEPALVSRIKVMAKMDIAERRLPQDGRFRFRDKSREVDFRVSVVPVLLGESVCMRLLDQGALRLDLTQLGFQPTSLEQFQNAIHASHGIIIITGPTGSGKTTTLYSAIEAVNIADINIMTAEDPVEYHIKGINQLQVHDDIGRTFVSVLRSFLRHDPDVILVGEMRDQETAQIAMRAALTGHLVLTTLHTNDAPSSAARLVDMGIPPFLVSASLRLVVAQRLARRVCAGCREAQEMDEASLVPYGHTPQGVGTFTAFQGKGCRSCSFTGMRGRIALYEVMPISDEIRGLISEGARTSAIRNQARQEGMKTLRETGLAKVIEGMTTVKEVLRVTSD
jgi:type IV pilus assembly protein PilB